MLENCPTLFRYQNKVCSFKLIVTFGKWLVVIGQDLFKLFQRVLFTYQETIDYLGSIHSVSYLLSTKADYYQVAWD